MEFDNGEVFKSEIQDFGSSKIPNELRLALVPVLYLHQEYVYPKMKPKKFNDE